MINSTAYSNTKPASTGCVTWALCTEHSARTHKTTRGWCCHRVLPLPGASRRRALPSWWLEARVKALALSAHETVFRSLLFRCKTLGPGLRRGKVNSYGPVRVAYVSRRTLPIDLIMSLKPHLSKAWTKHWGRTRSGPALQELLLPDPLQSGGRGRWGRSSQEECIDLQKTLVKDFITNQGSPFGQILLHPKNSVLYIESTWEQGL